MNLVKREAIAHPYNIPASPPQRRNPILLATFPEPTADLDRAFFDEGHRSPYPSPDSHPVQAHRLRFGVLVEVFLHP